MQHWYHPAALSFILFGALSISCGGGGEDEKGGGLVGFSTGTPQASPVPSDGTSVDAPKVTGVIVTNNPATNGEPLHVTVSFSDPQGDIAAVHVGIAGQSSHSVIAVTGIGVQTSGSLFIDLKPASKASGTYTLVVSITDGAGHSSVAVSVPFTILNPDGTLPSTGVDAGSVVSSPDSAPRPDLAPPTGDAGGGGTPDGGSGAQPGWYFTNVEYIIAPIDVTLQANGYHKAVAGLYDYSEGTGTKNDFRVKKWRVDEHGNHIAGSSSVSTWEDPPTYLAPGAVQKLKVSRHYEDSGSTWGQSGLGAHFDRDDLTSADYATSSKIAYVDANGSAYLHEFEGVIETEKVIPEGAPDSTKAVWIRLEAYSFKYVYRWRN